MNITIIMSIIRKIQNDAGQVSLDYLTGITIFILSFIPAPFPEMSTANILDMIRKGGFFK